jgi:Ni,Fe-hydrogenase III large subunit
MARTVIPFGPQHPVLPEPVHLDLVVEDEKVIEARPSIGFIHRGLEKLAETKDYIEFVYVAERICGICSFIHGQTYCQAIETIMNIAVPPRALYLRTVWGELSRIHSHLLWLGLMADGMGFESLFMHSWRMREKVLNIIEATTGGRVIFGSCKVGGVRRDINADMIKTILKDLDEIEKDMRDLTRVFINDQLGESAALRHRRAPNRKLGTSAASARCCGPAAWRRTCASLVTPRSRTSRWNRSRAPRAIPTPVAPSVARNFSSRSTSSGRPSRRFPMARSP